MVPPGRTTRTNSSAVAWWCGANIRTDAGHHHVETVVCERHRLCIGFDPLQVRRRAAPAMRRPASNSSECRMLTVTTAPATAAGMAVAGAAGHVQDLILRFHAHRADEFGPECRNQFRGKRDNHQTPTAPGAWPSVRGQLQRWSSRSPFRVGSMAPRLLAGCSADVWHL